MITHIVLFQPKPEVTEEQIMTLLADVRGLQQTIPGLLSVQAGENLNLKSEKNKGYTYGFVMQFSNLEALEGYVPHPSHQIVSVKLLGISQSIIDFDIPNIQK